VFWALDLLFLHWGMTPISSNPDETKLESFVNLLILNITHTSRFLACLTLVPPHSHLTIGAIKPCVSKVLNSWGPETPYPTVEWHHLHTSGLSLMSFSQGTTLALLQPLWS
jgi:hypothetical protein